MHWGREGETEHAGGAGAQKISREPQPPVEKPSQTSLSITFALHAITKMPAKEMTSLNGHHPYTQRVRRVNLRSLKTTWWRDRKGNQKDRAIWQKKNCGQELSSTSQRKLVSEVGVWDPGECPHPGSPLMQEMQVTSWVTLSREE